MLAARPRAAAMRVGGTRPAARARCGVRMMADSKVVDAVRAEGSRGSVVRNIKDPKLLTDPEYLT